MGQLLRPQAAPLDVSGLELSTAEGLTGYVARALARLAELPFDVKTAAVMAQLVGCQRQNIEQGELEKRIEALEARAMLNRRTA